MFALDASALLCLFNEEPGADRVGQILSRSIIGAVNMSEVVSKLIDRGFPEDRIDDYFESAKLTTIPFDAVQARAAGLLRSATRSIGASFADRACLALAAARGATAVTADRAWQRLDIGIKIELIR